LKREDSAVERVEPAVARNFSMEKVEEPKVRVVLEAGRPGEALLPVN
jgi:hypothetical protein